MHYVKLIPIREIQRWVDLSYTQIVMREKDNVMCAVVECSENEDGAMRVPGDFEDEDHGAT